MVEDLPGRRSPLLWHPILVGFAILLLSGALRVVAALAGVLLLGFLAVLLATLLSYPLDLFSRWMPRPLALIVTILLVAGVLIGVGFAAVPVLTVQGARFFQQLPVALGRLADLWNRLQRSGSVPPVPGPSIPERLAGEVEALIYKAVPFAVSAGSAVFTVFVLFVLALFLAYAPRTYLQGLRMLVPREHEEILDQAWTRLGVTLRHWVGGIVIAMFMMGLLASIGLLIAGIDGWLFLGILTFFGTFVPYVGAIASAVPALLVGLAEGPTKFLYALLVYVVVHLVEGYVVEPFVMKRAVRISPGVLLFWQLVVAALFGLPGIIVATPLLACLQVVVRHFYVERRLGKTPADA
jgi:predicted PurR-regulated permease PerM